MFISKLFSEVKVLKKITVERENFSFTYCLFSCIIYIAIPKSSLSHPAYMFHRIIQ